jgi:hypothetical protein
VEKQVVMGQAIDSLVTLSRRRRNKRLLVDEALKLKKKILTDRTLEPFEKNYRQTHICLRGCDASTRKIYVR